MSGRFLSRIDLASAKKVEEAFNALLKRGEVHELEKIRRLQHIVCGCGAQGCLFMHAEREQGVSDEPERAGR